MKNYYEFTFDKASFYDYTDDSKTCVAKRTYGEKIPPHFKTVFLEQLGACLFRELFTKKKYIMIDGDQLVGMGTRPNRKFKPHGVEITNGSLSKIKPNIIHDKLSMISGEGLSRQYLTMLNSMLVNAPLCSKLVRDNQVSIKRKCTINKDAISMEVIKDLRTNPLGYFRMLELKKEAEILRRNNK